MREAIGGTMLFWIVLFFMSIFIVFLSCVIQYAKVYRIKNTMINYLERGEGIESQDEFEEALNAFGYPISNGYVICRYNSINRGGYYYLKLYAKFTLPLVPFSINVKIKGETRIIETGVLIKGENWFPEDSVEPVCYGSDGMKQSELVRE